MAAGWALDLFRGGQTRKHGDIEIAIPAASFPELRSRFDRCRRVRHRHHLEAAFPLYWRLSCSVVAAAVAVTMEPASPRPYLVR